MFRFLCIAFLLLSAQLAFVHADDSTPRIHNSHTSGALIGPLGRRTAMEVALTGLAALVGVAEAYPQVYLLGRLPVLL